MYPSLMVDMLEIDCTPAEAIRLASRHGFEGIDLRLNGNGQVIGPCDADELHESIIHSGLKPGYCSLLPGKISVDECAWQAGIHDLAQRAELAQRIGYTRTSTVILPYHPNLPFEQAFEHHVERVRSVAPILRDHGLTLGLEYVSPRTRRAGRPNEFIHDMRGTLRLIEACGDGVGLMLDSFHWYCAGESLEDLIELKSDQVVVVHLNDAVGGIPIEEQAVTLRELPGATGVIDLLGFLGGLEAVGYDGPVTAEPTNPCWQAISAHEAVAMTSQALHDLLSRVHV